MTIKEILDKLEETNSKLPVSLENALQVDLTGKAHAQYNSFIQLALEYDLDTRVKNYITVGALKKLLKSYIGKTFKEPNGDKFVVTEKTEVYLDNHYCWSKYFISSVGFSEFGCLLYVEKEW